MYTTTTTHTVAYTAIPCPEAYITKGKNRLKQNGSTVYLKNNDEFEIELFNPRPNNVLVKIKINGNLISQRGLILKPGMRYHLDRYIDIAKKFLFTTYEVDGSNDAVQKAIENNGDIQIDFYDEIIKPAPAPSYPLIKINDYPKYPFNDVWYNNNNNNVYYSNTNSGTPTFATMDMLGFADMSNTIVGKSSFTSNAQTKAKRRVTLSNDIGGSVLRSQSLETGRVEKGSTSNQTFTEVDMDFSPTTINTVTWKILPESQQPIEPLAVKNYCPSCNTRIRKTNWKFCPTCGEEL